ncbi:ATP-binding cassette domain-containing protein [Baekduia soli]|uniref:ATP-binding cassette domain-containing protein n=1 Tax=Baekduia soli TaxID=496014 RepID=A0A5B8UC29_9ACTN|nr:ATP-binding cassette domain-containing protein [Baekduia soli]
MPCRGGRRRAAPPPSVLARGLTERHGSTVALDDLDLVRRRGEIYGYLGPSGAGETTTIRLLLRLHRPSPGDAALSGLDAWHDAVAAHARVAYVPGEPFLRPALTSAETFADLARRHGGTDRAHRDVLVDRRRRDVVGDVGPLIAALAGHPVAALTSREPSLEEIFLHHHDPADDDARGQGGPAPRPGAAPAAIAASARG